ncbi:hypothetical protein PBY51_002441 [Eleginops maclovinus]|uniref:Uncharacterized protein n=1 Tax=Eleginops maclovinus TaxID=56733 RepID=A0AAN7X8C8_ELEMC|nr:hypothetical protein PBY51_002441 [Eleginops maclovinus]
MSVHTSQKTMTYRTLKVATPEPLTSTMISSCPVSPTPLTSTVISSGQVSPAPYAMNGTFESVRYLVPMQQGIQQQQQQTYIPVQQGMQQQQTYIPVQQGMQQQYIIMQQPMMQQPMMQQMVSPVYLQGMSHLSVSSQDSTDNCQQHIRNEVSPMVS